MQLQVEETVTKYGRRKSSGRVTTNIIKESRAHSYRQKVKSRTIRVPFDEFIDVEVEKEKPVHITSERVTVKLNPIDQYIDEVSFLRI